MSSAGTSLGPTLATLLAAPGSHFIHRDLSWLQFNLRVLAEATDKTNPPLERMKFLAITSSNLDEFFMIRFASMQRSISTYLRLGNEKQSKQLERLLSFILHEVKNLRTKQAHVLDEIAKEVQKHGIRISVAPHAQSQDSDLATLGKEVFDKYIFPHLQPEPFTIKNLPILGNLQLAFMGLANSPGTTSGRLWIPIPKSLPHTFVAGPEKTTVFFLDELILSHAGPAFGFATVYGMLRLTRDGDFTVDLEEEDTESIPDVVRSGIRRRDKGRAVRLQFVGQFPPELTKQALSILRLQSAQLLPAPHTLCLQGLWSAVNQIPEGVATRPGLMFSPVVPVLPLPFKTPETLFNTLKGRDILLHHPYDAFEAFVTWIRTACTDPDVVSIELTVYRTDAVSPVIDLLKAHAKSKLVRVIIELRARFDELNNLRLAEDLRAAGVEVAFGFGKLKLHAKIALVTRKEEGKNQYYTHVSTGNYNSATARQYTDLGILTAHQEIGADARLFFDSVWDGKIPTSFKQLLSAPAKMHRRILHHIEAETRAAFQGKSARIVAKVNALVDESIIEHLYRASSAGVKVDLIVRGACSLVPGVKGLSENIRVVSIVDRFLEHSRIYYFETAQVMYLSSADWMPRNFFSRLELAYPVLDTKIFNFLKDVVIPTYLSDTVKARELHSDGEWKARTKIAGESPLRSQYFFQELANNHYKGTPLE